jgi:predicted Fe-S protein YdhL (DUF1289 family)
VTRSLRRTPCVGICSTTYGDLVCRGCKRFAHEIVQWNGFSDDQQRLVWTRLFRLREGALLEHARIENENLVRQQAHSFKVQDADKLTAASAGYEVLRRCVDSMVFDDIGIQPLNRVPLAGPATVSELYQRVERELLRRSVAQYERDFHVPAQ